MSAAEPRKRHPVLRSLAAVGAAAVLLVSVTGYAAARRYDNKIQRVALASVLGSDRGADVVEGASMDSMNVLLVGIDNRDGLTREQLNEWHLGHAGTYGNQTDTIMVVHIGKDAGHVTVVSLPRDSLVQIPAHKDADGKEVAAYDDKINAAFTVGGAPLLVETVEKATGIPIDHYVGVSFKGFMGMVDAVDGVDVCLAAPIKDNPKYTSLDLPAGKSTLRGGMAMSFVRARHVGTDFGRIQRQQQFMASLLKKATSLGIVTNPVRLDQFVSAAAESLQIDDTLDRGQILELAAKMSAIKLDQIEFARLPIANDNATDPKTGKTGYVTWEPAGAKKIFNSIITDQPLVVKKSGSTAAAKPKSEAAPANITVKVLNGSGMTGLGKQAVTELKKLGFKVDGAAETDSGDPRTSTVIRYPELAVAGLGTLMQVFPGARAVPLTHNETEFEVSVGKSFTGVSELPASDAATPEASSIQMRVLNGSGEGGKAQAVADELTALGFTMAADPTKAPGESTGDTTIKYDPADSAGLATVIKAFPGAMFEPGENLGGVYEVTVGANFGHVSDPSVVIPTAVPTSEEELTKAKTVVSSTEVCGEG